MRDISKLKGIIASCTLYPLIRYLEKVEVGIFNPPIFNPPGGLKIPTYVKMRSITITFRGVLFAAVCCLLWGIYKARKCLWSSRPGHPISPPRPLLAHVLSRHDGCCAAEHSAQHQRGQLDTSCFLGNKARLRVFPKHHCAKRLSKAT